MPKYLEQKWSNVKKIPFKIIPGSNENLENPYYVSLGFLFSTFSMDYNASVPINGINQEFDFLPDHKIYIEIDIDENLQPYYAEIKCTKVNEDNWKHYPFPALIEPEFSEESREKFDEFPWDSGRVLKLLPSRRQTKLYILIGYRNDDKNKNGNLELDTKIGGSPVQILKENVILLHGTIDYAPGLFAFPYFFGGLTHINSINDK